MDLSIPYNLNLKKYDCLIITNRAKPKLKSLPRIKNLTVKFCRRAHIRDNKRAGKENRGEERRVSGTGGQLID